MSFSISNTAVSLYKEIELGAKEGIRLFAKYAGGETGGFGLGVSKDVPSEDDVIQEIQGIRFFVKPDDFWFVKNMKLDYDIYEDRFLCEIPELA